MFRNSSFVLLLITPLFASKLTLTTAAEQFLEHNYDIRIAHQEADKSKADLTAAERRSNPVLSTSYDYWDIQHHFNDVSASASALVTVHLDHPIELGGKRTRRIQTAKAGITYANDLLEETKREQLFTLIDAYYQTQSDETNLANAIANRHDYEAVLAIGKAKYDHGFLSEIDLEKLHLQTIDYDNEIKKYRAALSSDKESLAFLLSLRADTFSLSPAALPENFTKDLDELIAYAQQHRTDCIAAQHNVQLSSAAVELEKANAVPDITVGMESEHYAPTYKPLLVGLSVSVPLPVYDRNQGAIQKSRITALQASTQQSKVLEQAASEIRQAFIRYQSQQSIYQSMLHGFDSAKGLKEKEEKIFALKGISILELIDAQKNYRDYQKNMTQAIIDLNIALAQLKLSSGLSF